MLCVALTDLLRGRVPSDTLVPTTTANAFVLQLCMLFLQRGERVMLRVALTDLLRDRVPSDALVPSAKSFCFLIFRILPLQRGERVMLRVALTDLLRGRVSSDALMPTRTEILQNLALQSISLPENELLTVLKVPASRCLCLRLSFLAINLCSSSWRRRVSACRRTSC